MPYLLDSDTFIAAKNNYYRFTFCPGYWDWIIQSNNAGKVFSIDKIRAELARGDKTDELIKWTRGTPPSLFISAPSNISVSLTQIAQWANNRSYTPAAVNVFLASGDYYLVAYAHALGYKVITNETPDPISHKRIKVPDACQAARVGFANPFQMLEDEGAKFVC